jgi:hypothetical protein
VGNRVVARRMIEFFRNLDGEVRRDPATVAQRYGQHLFAPTRHTLLDEKKLSRSRFYVGITADGGRRSFEHLTRRATLISDTLLLSHGWNSAYHDLGVRYRLDLRERPSQPTAAFGDWRSAAADFYGDSTARRQERELNNRTLSYGMHCPDLNGLGGWILDAEPLLTAGLAWYLPSYSLSEFLTIDGERRDMPHQKKEQLKAVDVVIRNGRAVEASGELPIKNHLVREILRAEVPFLDGVALRDFGRITVDEFDAYSAFRDFMRHSLLDIDTALNDVQSERALVRIGIEINNGLRSVRADMERAQRKRAVAASGAILGSVSTVLLAVYGPALATALAAIGAGGGLWGVINAMAENNTRSLREDKWYYVWALSRKANRF